MNAQHPHSVSIRSFDCLIYHLIHGYGFVYNVVGGCPDNKRPAEELKKMKAAGAKDIDVCFVAIAYLVAGALQTIKAALSDLSEIRPVSVWSLIKPWEIQRINEKTARVSEYSEVLEKLSAQLENAISIASYCINLMQLENVLDGTSVIVNTSVR